MTKSFDISPNIFIKLQQAYDDGWSLDTFSTFLSRKVYQHKLIGPYRLYRMVKIKES